MFLYTYYIHIFFLGMLLFHLVLAGSGLPAGKGDVVASKACYSARVF